MVKKPKPKLTPEERKQLKIEKKLARQRELEEKKRQTKRDYLSREVKYGRFNRRKLEKKWYKMLLAIKQPVLQIEFQAAVNNIELLLDRKDYKISFLMDELDEAEEQYNFMLKSHVENMNKILRLYHVRLDDLKREYDTEYACLMMEANNERTLMKQRMDTENESLNIMIFHLDKERKEVEKDTRSQYLSKLNEETSKNVQDLGLMMLGLEQTFIKTWHQFNIIMQNYANSTEQKQKASDIYYSHDVSTTKLIKEQGAQLYILHKKLDKLKDKQLLAKQDLDKYVEFKINERDYFKNAYECLRLKFEIDWKYDVQQLKCLVLSSNDCIRVLEKKEKHCESVMKMYSISYKLETQKEKFLPFLKPAPHCRHKSVMHSSEFHFGVEEFKELDSFWMKFGQGDTLRHCINEEREFLKKENALLRRYIKQYCSCTSEL